MSSQRQIDANRLNAQKSTGPTSVAGKARSSLNALKTGIFAQSEVLPSEDPAALEILTAEYYDHFRPTTPDQRGYVDDLISCEWTLRRLRTAETQLWQTELKSCYKPDPSFPLGHAFSRAAKQFAILQRRFDATRRGYRHAHESLRQLLAQPEIPEPAPVPGPPAPEPTPPQPQPPSATPSPQTTSARNGSEFSNRPEPPNVPTESCFQPPAQPDEIVPPSQKGTRS